MFMFIYFTCTMYYLCVADEASTEKTHVFYKSLSDDPLETDVVHDVHIVMAIIDHVFPSYSSVAT